MSAVKRALRIARSRRKKYADGGEALPDVGDPLIGDGGEFSSGNKYANKAADIASKIAGPMTIDAGTAGPLRRFVKSTVDASKYAPGSEEAREAYGDVGNSTGEMAMSMVGSKGRPNTSGVFVGPYGAHMLRQEAREAENSLGRPVRELGGELPNQYNPHPVYAEEAKQAASQLRPEFQQAYKGWQQDARDAQARGILEMREGSQNPAHRDLWQGSGWQRGAEGAMQKEIPDLGAKLVPLKGAGSNAFVLEHPAGDLHKLYDVPPIQFDPGIKPGTGYFDFKTNEIVLGGRPTKANLEKGTSLVLHEFGHAISKKEGFAQGANPMAMTRDRPGEITSELFPEIGGVEDLIKWGPSGFGKQQAHIPSWQTNLVEKQTAKGTDPATEKAAYQRAVFSAYQKAAGEVSSRNIQDRRAKGYRYQSHPEDTEDVKRGLQWVDRVYQPRPRKDIQIHDTRYMAPDEIIPGGAHRIYGPDKRSAGQKFRDYAKWRQENPRGTYEEKAGGGSVSNFNPERASAFGLARQGMIKSTVPGRTDKLELDVPTGSYIIPADIPSALGQGNSEAGNSILNKMFTKGPYGMNLPKSRSGSRIGTRKSALSKMRMGFAEGGETEATPIVAAGGEYVIHPESVAQLGGGDLDLGHSILDAFVKQTRAKHISTLKGLKPPKGS